APHWHISDDGRLELGVQGPNQKGGVHYLTDESILTPERMGQWVHLAVVYDRKNGRVTHYADGRVVKREDLKLDIDLQLGDAEIGNWNAGSRKTKSTIRYFTGCIDEFLMFSRALADEEIERLYVRGRPPS